MSMFAGFFMGDYLSYAAAYSMRSQSMDAYFAHSSAAMANANRPTVHDRYRLLRERFGIPDVSEDVQ